MSAKCTVRFKRYTWGAGARGVVAILMWRGKSLNSVDIPPTHVQRHKPVLSQLRRVRAQLMRGCAELVRDEQRRARRRR